MNNYKLSANLVAHNLDVRGIDYDQDNNIISASRDSLVISWKRNIDNTYEPDMNYAFHKGYVICLYYLKPNEQYQKGLILSGGVDKTINVYEPGAIEPMYVLIGHDNTISSISSTPDGSIISGSWDSTAKIWKDWSCQYTLKGHTLAIWAVLGLSNNMTLTASADKSIKLWENDKCIHTFVGHSDCVRGLASISDDKFVSCSNDGSLRIWDMEGNCLNELYSHTAFVYCVKYNQATDEIISCGEDRTVKIWKDNECKQTISHPAVSVWCVQAFPNGDIASGSSDNIIRVFTRDPERIANEELIKQFEDSVSNFSVASNGMNIDKKDIKDKSFLDTPGTKDGQVAMIKNGKDIEAYQWSNSELKWVKVGVVVDTASSKKTLFEGKEYDYVFDIDIGDGSILRLPYNANDNPYQAAQEFIWKHELSQDFLDQIAMFIINNSKPITLDQTNTPSTAATPFTSSRYVPGGSNKTNNPSSAATPFTSSRYVPGGSSNYQPVNTTTKQTYIPKDGYTIFKIGDADKIISKILEFNEKIKVEIAEKSLSEEDVENLSELAIIFEKPSVEEFKKQFNQKHMDTIKKLCIEWPVNYRFPCLDLLRMCSIYTAQPIQDNNKDFIVELLKRNFPLSPKEKTAEGESDKFTVNCRMFIFRFISNLFASKIGKSFINENIKLIIDCIEKTANDNSNKFFKFALITTILNFTVLIKDTEDYEHAFQFLELLNIAMENENFTDNQFRIGIAIGNLLHYYSSMKEAANLLSNVSNASSLYSKSSDEKVRDVANELKKLL
ncbi:PFU-domain-containing protein [Anaeromyces robustus]|uniref:PFU-domain-containing protein n=1 Tax=Anaeromyces robustus TaxID=1754192 RepID=A0A1Y1XMD6_9FUNG|nr:PFU-domain-containing protein [Anaeromyces robustus]|eukprot:ORX86908.1 PFU-domain-containing protein [Anaeromyces robustus]